MPKKHWIEKGEKANQKTIKKMMRSWINSNKRNEEEVWMKKTGRKTPTNKTRLSRQKTFLLNRNSTGTIL